MERRNILIFVFSLLLSILILLSQNFWIQGENVSEFFDWMGYESISGWVYVSWQDSFLQFLYPLTYFPSVAGVIGILGAFIVLISIKGAKILYIVTAIFAILAYGLFILFYGLFGFIVSSALLIPNLPGAYFCLIPGLILLILAFSLKSKKIGQVRENKQYYAIGGESKPVVPLKGPIIHCPNCSALIQADSLFCEECGKYL